MPKTISTPVNQTTQLLATVINSDIPVGTIFQTVNADQRYLSVNWRSFDGGLIKRSEYPLAKNIFGDVRFFSATPNTTNYDFSMTSLSATNVSASKMIAVGNNIVILYQLF